MNRNTKLLTATIAIILLGILYLHPSTPSQNEPSTPINSTNIPIANDFGSRLVYTTEIDTDPQPFKTDCERRNGTFSTCGSTCPPNAEICATVCALTCENIPQN